MDHLNLPQSAIVVPLNGNHSRDAANAPFTHLRGIYRRRILGRESAPLSSRSSLIRQILDSLLSKFVGSSKNASHRSRVIRADEFPKSMCFTDLSRSLQPSLS